MYMYRRIAGSLFVGLIAAAMILSASPAFAQPLDHFKCYNTTESTLERPFLVTLDDQFVTGDVVQVVNAVWFCNPVQKTSQGVTTPILEPANHLTLYPFAIKETAPRRRVTIDNQFGLQTINVTAPRLLAVPTEKNGDPMVDPINHFKCYEATGPALNAPVTLVDQFHTEQARLLAPRYFCNPTAKTFNGVTEPIVDGPPLDHLACYKLTPSDQPPVDFVQVDNQFDSEIFKIEPSQFVCVPSDKLAVN
jgi:hypothetical protein